MTASTVARGRARSVWARPEPTARQPRFSREKIAAAAFGIADAEGFEAVSMRRIAAVLGGGTMSLYRYIETKDDLLSLIDDAILGEALITGDLPPDWRQALALVARGYRHAYLRHPWAVHVLLGRTAAPASMVGPNGLCHLEQSLAALGGAPLSTSAKLDLLAVVDCYVVGHILRVAEVADRGKRGTTDSDAATAREFFDTQVAARQLPHLAAVVADPALFTVPSRAELDARFERGLLLLIDGAAAGLLPAS